ALAMSDRVAVMNEGRIEQVSSAEGIYNRPETAFAATFVGEQNVFQGKVVATAGEGISVETDHGLLHGVNRNDLALGEAALVMVRPEQIELMNGNAVGAAERGLNTIAARLERRDLEGALINLYLRAGGHRVHVNMHNTGETDLSGHDDFTLGFHHRHTVVMRPGAVAQDKV
ncbi:MAG: TOBE domain-containing protein, partial [Zavarzinia sp.]|nr:TOBE domain-containing protein [Zavarzinia sp.]